MRRSSQVVITKGIIAVVILSALAGVAGSQLAPGASFLTVLMYSAAGLAAFVAVLLVVTVAGLTFRQLVLRKGGTDPQWFWFSSEPRGLQELREQVAAQAREAKHGT